MNTKKLFRVMALTAILTMLTVLSLTGCGGGNGNAPPVATVPVNDTPNPDKPPQNPPGGTGWKTVTDSNIGTFPIFAIAYGDGKFVVNALTGMSTSTDGITWTVPTNIEINPNVIAYGNGKFVAGSYNGKMAYSSDGITWEAATTNIPFGFSLDDVSAIAYGNGIFVAGSNVTGSKAVYSSDGITWEAIPGGVLGLITDHDYYLYNYYIYIGKPFGVNAIAYGNGMFVAGGGRSKIAYSSDGITWKAATTSALGTIDINVIAYGNGMFVAGGYNGKMAYSSDGVTWTAVADSTFGTSDIYAIAYGNGKFIAGGYKCKMAVSTDGETWTAITDNPFGISEIGNINGIAYGNGKFVAVGYTDILVGKMVCLSDD